MKLIKALQESIKVLYSSQQQLIMHTQSLEDTVIALSNSENDLVNYDRAQKIKKV